jgi:hypothetical protein
MANEADIEAALTKCNLYLDPNYSKIAAANSVGRTTLSRRYKGQTTSRALANSIYR